MKKFCLVKSLTFKTQKLEKFLQGACMGSRILRSILVHVLLAIEIKILFLKLIIALNLNFSSNESWTKMEDGSFDSHTNPLPAFFYFLGFKGK